MAHASFLLDRRKGVAVRTRNVSSESWRDSRARMPPAFSAGLLVCTGADLVRVAEPPALALSAFHRRARTRPRWDAGPGTAGTGGRAPRGLRTARTRPRRLRPVPGRRDRRAAGDPEDCDWPAPQLAALSATVNTLGGLRHRLRHRVRGASGTLAADGLPVAVTPHVTTQTTLPTPDPSLGAPNTARHAATTGSMSDLKAAGPVELRPCRAWANLVGTRFR